VHLATIAAMVTDPQLMPIPPGLQAVGTRDGEFKDVAARHPKHSAEEHIFDRSDHLERPIVRADGLQTGRNRHQLRVGHHRRDGSHLHMTTPPGPRM
jgi:hypothetical protein